MISNWKDARAAWTPSRPLTLVHNVDAVESFEEQAKRKTEELRQLSHDIRQMRQTLEAMENTRCRVADELEATMRALSRRIAK